MNFSKTKKNSSSKQSLGGQKIVPILFLASLLVIWELACKLFSIPLYVLPSPVQVIQSLFTESATLSHHAAVTVMEAVIGILLSLILAIVLGILMDCFPLVRQGIYPLLVVTQTVPMIVLAPILIIYMGFGIAPKILTVILMCFFPIAVSFSDGLAQVDEEYVHLVRSYGASRLSAYRLVKIPRRFRRFYPVSRFPRHTASAVPLSANGSVPRKDSAIICYASKMAICWIASSPAF